MNSFWMPKKQPLYAPMLSTFGGGSARGFNPGGGGGAGALYTNFSSFTFQGLQNNNNLVGYLGPTYTGLMGSSTYQAAPFYNDTSLFNVTSTGIQVWTVPETADYTIEARSPGGVNQEYDSLAMTDGVTITGTVSLTVGEKVYILPGHPGNVVADANSSSPGSGGTFVVMVPSGYESNPSSALSQVTLSDVLIVCGAGSKFHSGYTPGSHPSGFDTESSTVSSGRFGSGRGAHFGNDGGPSGGAGLFLPAFEHTTTVGTFDKTWSFGDEAILYDYVADSFVTGGRGGRGYKNNTATAQANSGMNGSGGFGGGGGMSDGNSYSAGSGGMMGGYETNTSTSSYPGNSYPASSDDAVGAGSSYVNTSRVSSVSSSNYGNHYGSVEFTKV
jgi:hypothetical protein